MDTLRLYADIARLRSLSQAAQRHGITQSAASQRMAQLEKSIGVALLDRSVRPLGLTEAGRLYLNGVQEALAAMDAAEAKVKALTAAPLTAGSAAAHLRLRGEVRVAAIYSAGMELLGDLAHSFAKTHPGVTLHVEYQKPDSVYRAVVDGQADLGIVSYPERMAQVRVLPLRDEPMGLVGPARPGSTALALALAAPGGVRAADLSGIPMLGFDLALPIGRRIEQHLKKNGCAEAQIEHRFDNIDSIKSAILAMNLPAILPLCCAKREIAQGLLRAVPLAPELARPIAVITPKDAALLSPAAKAVLEELMKEVKDGPNAPHIPLKSAA